MELGSLIDQLSGLSDRDTALIDDEIANAERRLTLLKKLRAMVPEPGPLKPSIAGALNRTYKKQRKAGGEAARHQSKKESADRSGNLMTSEERRLAMAKLIDKHGAMTPGALAASLKCDVKDIYNSLNSGPGPSFFGKSSEGVVLLGGGRQELLKG